MEIRGFRGWRFHSEDVSNHIAPPYDILDAADKDRLLANCAENIVAVDLPHVPPRQAGPDEVYHRAADRLRQWQNDGLLVRETRPAIYVYKQTYEWAGVTRSRLAMLAGVRATEFGEDVIPHEHTFDGPKADRLKLTQQTLTHLSPIFGFYNDPDGAVGARLHAAMHAAPDATGTLNGVTEKLWCVDDEATIAAVAEALRAEPVFIADGHHRYTTAKDYAKALRQAGQIDTNHEANFVLFALVARDDPGLLVLPAHRVISGLADDWRFDDLAAALEGTFAIQRAHDRADLSDIDAVLANDGPHTMIALAADGVWTLHLTAPEAMGAAAPDRCEAWRQLDVAILQELIVDGPLSRWKTDDCFCAYTPDGDRARADVAEGKAQVAFCLRGTPLSAVEAVARAGDTMPHKSTYFYPKLATGMVLKPLQ